jgi:hypothetical protein
MLRLFLFFVLVSLALHFFSKLQDSIQRYTDCLGFMIIERMYDPEYSCRFSIDLSFSHSW